MSSFKKFLIAVGISLFLLVIDINVQEMKYEKNSKAERVYLRFKYWTSKKIEEYI